MQTKEVEQNADDTDCTDKREFINIFIKIRFVNYFNQKYNYGLSDCTDVAMQRIKED